MPDSLTPMTLVLAAASVAGTVGFFLTIPKLTRKPFPIALAVLCGLCGVIVLVAALISHGAGTR